MAGGPVGWAAVLSECAPPCTLSVGGLPEGAAPESYKKKPEARRQFQLSLGRRLRALQLASTTRPLELWACDESRFGLQPVRRRRLTGPGVKPVGVIHPRWHSFWLYGVVAPRTGDGYLAVRSALTHAHFQTFLDEFAAHHPHTLNVLLLDNAPAHRARALRLPENIVLLFQPPYAPELKPCERVWLALKSHLAWRCFSDLAQLQEQLAAFVAAFDPTTFQSLIAYPYLMDALHALPFT